MDYISVPQAEQTLCGSWLRIGTYIFFPNTIGFQILQSWNSDNCNVVMHTKRCQFPPGPRVFGWLPPLATIVPPMPVKGSLDMQSDSLIIALSPCFLSESPLDSDVNMRTWTRCRPWRAASRKLSHPIPKVASLYLSGFGQRHTLSVNRDIVSLWAVSQSLAHGCSVEIDFRWQSM